MMNTFKPVVLVFLYQLVCYVHLTQIEDTTALLSRVLKAFDKSLDFFEENVNEMNLDGIFGLRLAEGVFESTLKTLDSHQLQLTKWTNERRMRTLKTRTTSIIQQSIPYLKASNKTYFNQVGFAVANKWKIVRPFRKLVHRPSNVTEHDVRNKSGFAMQPCMEAIHGSGGSAQCNITNECWKLMTRTDGMGYTLTHQALYYMFAQQINGCSSVITAKLNQSNIHGGIDHMYDVICSSIYPQSIILGRINKKTGQLDMYFEQAVICGILGFEDFLSIPRLRELLRGQFPSGCYGDQKYNPKLSNKMTLEAHRLYTRHSKLLGDGCESHITGVGTALLSLYIRWLACNNECSNSYRFTLPE